MQAAERKNIASRSAAASHRGVPSVAALALEGSNRPTPCSRRIILGNLAQLETNFQATGRRRGPSGFAPTRHPGSLAGSSVRSSNSILGAHRPRRAISVRGSSGGGGGRADIGIFGGNIPGQELEVLPYRSDRLVVLVEASHPLAGRSSLRFRDLVDHDFVSLEKGSSIETLCTKAAAGLGKHLKLRIRVSGFDALFRLVETGMGLGVVPLEIIRDRHGLEKIVAVCLDESWAQRELVMGVRDYKSLPPITRMLVDHLRTAPAEASGHENRGMSERLTVVSDRS